MGISGIGATSSLLVQSIADMRNQLDDLQRQLGTGKKSDTYAGLGLGRGFAVGLRSQISALGAYGNTIGLVGVRLDVAQTTLSQIGSLQRTVKGVALTSQYSIDNIGQTADQRTATGQLDQILGLLNTQAGDRYLFSGRATDQPAVDTIDHILNGDGARAGFKQVMAERNAADLGASGLGRLVIPAAAGTTLSVSEDVAGSPFGFKLAGITSALTGATITGPTGSPASISVNLGATNPNAGDTIKFSFTLPDGSTENLSLTATTSSTPGPNEFAIGATSAATAINLRAALTGAVGKLANTSLTAASAIAAANDFFNTDAANPARRVVGPPFNTATALVAGTPANTVSWYTGDAGTDLARSTAVARVDQAATVSYGARANEQGIRSIVAAMAVFGSMSFSPSDPDAQDRYDALKQRVAASLDGTPGTQKIEDIEADFAGAQATLGAAKTRQQQTQGTLNDMLQQIEGAPQEQVAAQILALQTNLQASLATTARLYQMSLVNYLA